jgi:Icc-related predicted phosphoesterase
MIRVAAFGDCHVGADTHGRLRAHLQHVHEHADVLLLAGDLTKCGTVAEAELVASELDDVRVPTFAVLGNHDFHADEANAVSKTLEARGITVLDGDTAVLHVNATTVGIAGVKGFGGGFEGACATEFGEPEMKAFVGHSKHTAGRLLDALGSLQTDVRVALLHYAPVPDTLEGERPQIYPFLGSYLLAEAIDAAGADLVLHGHAHNGRENGVTPGGVPVRNVAQPVIRSAYRVYDVG